MRTLIIHTTIKLMYKIKIVFILLKRVVKNENKWEDRIMKGKILKLRHLLTMAILVACLVGCGNQESTTTEPTTEVEEPTVAEKPTDEMEPEEVEEKEEPKQEEVTEEPKEEETSTDMPEAQVTTTANEVGGLLAYMESLDPQKPAIIIYNEDDGGTIVNIQEGQHYSLKEGDKIIVNRCWDAIESWAFDTNIVSNKYDEISNYAVILSPDYTKFDKKQKFFYSIWLTTDTDEEPLTITCYLDAPAE